MSSKWSSKTFTNRLGEEYLKSKYRYREAALPAELASEARYMQKIIIYYAENNLDVDEVIHTWIARYSFLLVKLEKEGIEIEESDKLKTILALEGYGI